MTPWDCYMMHWVGHKKNALERRWGSIVSVAAGNRGSVSNARRNRVVHPEPPQEDIGGPSTDVVGVFVSANRLEADPRLGTLSILFNIQMSDSVPTDVCPGKQRKTSVALSIKLVWVMFA